MKAINIIKLQIVQEIKRKIQYNKRMLTSKQKQNKCTEYHIQQNSINIIIQALIYEMGSSCCQSGQDNYELKHDKQHKYETEEILWRKGFPDPDVGISLNQINEYVRPISKISQINKKVFKVVQYQKKFKTSLKINKKPINHNRLPDTYYLPQLQMFYVGEWICDPVLGKDVPGGIGRLYEDESISQGVFKTFLLNSDEAKLLNKEEQNQEKENLTASRGYTTKKNLILLDAYGNSVGKEKKEISNEQNQIQQNIISSRNNISNQFVVKLHGSGRIKSIQQGSTDEIQLQGQFYYGVLNGKGSLKITRNSEEYYSYLGLWKNGQKHGKGSESVKCSNHHNDNEIFSKQYSKYKFKGQNKQSFYYQGTFFENSKHGKGQLTFIGSKKDQNSVERDIARMQNKILIDGQSLKKQAYKKTALRQFKQRLIQKQLTEKYPALPCSSIQLKQQYALIYDSVFIMQRNSRTIFNEKYSGEFKNGKMDGQGTYVWPNGKIYKGKWKDNMMNDQGGQFYWSDGSYYQGGYLNDQKHGKGIMVWNQFKRYRGDWAFGYRHGYGQSIELAQKNENGQQKRKHVEMKIICSIWQKDKAIKKLKELNIKLMNYYSQDQRIVAEVQQMFMSDEEKKRMKTQIKVEKKLNNQQNEDGILNLQSLKDIAAQNFKSTFSNLQSAN